MAKGGANERDKSRDWSIWWSEGLDIDPPRDDVFYRTHGSGSRARMRANVGKKTHGSYGDMQAVDPIGEPLIQICTFEFKKGYNDLDTLSCIDSRGKKPLLKIFLDQVIRDAKEASNEPFLVIHRDYKKPCVMFKISLLADMELFCGEMIVNNLVLDYEGNKFIIFRLEDFFSWADPKYFVEKWKKLTGKKLVFLEE